MAQLNFDVFSPVLTRIAFASISTLLNDCDIALKQAEFSGPAAIPAFKEKTVRTERKLWDRRYVDRNPGPNSVRLSPGFIVCFPNLRSKDDLKVEDKTVLDLEGSKVRLIRLRTSDEPLHREIYKTVHKAEAAIHRQPAYASAHAIAGMVPGENLPSAQKRPLGRVEPIETYSKTMVIAGQNAPSTQRRYTGEGRRLQCD